MKITCLETPPIVVTHQIISTIYCLLTEQQNKTNNLHLLLNLRISNNFLKINLNTFLVKSTLLRLPNLYLA